MDRRSLFQYGASSEFEATISSPSWLPGDNTVGGSDESSAGIPASYIVRRDRLLFLTLTFWETEWDAVHALIAFGQGSGVLTWFPDADEPASFAVYLQAPKAGEAFNPTRQGNFPRVFEQQVVLRNAAPATNPWTPYFADRIES